MTLCNAIQLGQATVLWRT